MLSDDSASFRDYNCKIESFLGFFFYFFNFIDLNEMKTQKNFNFSKLSIK